MTDSTPLWLFSFTTGSIMICFFTLLHVHAAISFDLRDRIESLKARVSELEGKPQEPKS